MGKLFSDAECAHIFQAVTGHPPCGPSGINGAAPVVVTPAVPGPGVCIPISSIPHTSPSAHPSVSELGASASSVLSSLDDIAKSMSSVPLLQTGLAGKVKVSRPVPSLSDSPKRSNFDLTGAKLVKRGVLVSWHGMRFTVSMVRMGICYPAYPSIFRLPYYVDCNSVQVVA